MAFLFSELSPEVLYMSFRRMIMKMLSPQFLLLIYKHFCCDILLE